MIRAIIILYLLAFLCVVVGLWDHSWQLILAGTAILVVWPIIQEEVTPHETHHDPDDGGDHGSNLGVRVSADSRLLDPNDWVEGPPGCWTLREESRAGCGTRTIDFEEWLKEHDDASS